MQLRPIHIETVACASAAHLPQRTRAALAGVADPDPGLRPALTCAAYRDGWIVSTDAVDRDDIDALRRMHPELVRLLELAYIEGAVALRLAPDAPTVQGLAVFS